jgi:tetratricopeptide (TPR) repeat protein
MHRAKFWIPCALIALVASQAVAQGAGDLRNGARQVAAQISSQKSAGQFTASAQQRAVEELGQLVMRFIDLSDRSANVGGSRDRDGLLAAYQAIDPPLSGIYSDNSGNLERMARKVMDEDGDLEALYETQSFRESQAVASQALYFLNWLNYYGARLYEGAKRKELYEKAERGFSEFAVGDRRSDLLVESLLGRGLCHLELGQIEFATHDLEAVANDAQASPERRAKARLALLDAYVRTDNTKEALRLSDELLGGGGARGEDNVVRFLRIQALLNAAKKSSGAEADRYRQQALAQMDQLRRAGPGWEERVAALTATAIDNPEKWSANASSPFAKWELAKLLVQKGDYKGATPLLEGLLAGNDDALRKYAGEAHYLLGLAKFQSGDVDQAATHLEAAMQGDDNPAYGADASYMYFKSMEMLVAKQPDSDHAARYERAVRQYSSRYPDHRSAFEAQFRLGELLQAQGQFSDALEAYAKVKGDPGFELRAQFAMLQCQFERLQSVDGRDVDDALPVEQMRAKAAIMHAVHQNLLPDANQEAMLNALAGFEKRHPQQTDLFPQVSKLRLVAYQRLGRFADAEAEAKAHGPQLMATYGAAGIEELAVGFVREGARRRAQEGDAANQSAQQVALRLYEQLPVDGDGGGGKAKLTLARLYENTGDLDKAEALYAEILRGSDTSTTALRGLARIAEARQRPADALGYWRQFERIARPGDAPWYEGKYQVARLTGATGKPAEACQQLQQLKPAMPGLSDVELRKQLSELYQQVCK